MLKKITLLFCFFSFTFTIAPAFADNDREYPVGAKMAFVVLYDQAQKGDVSAQTRVARMLEYGDYVDKNLEEAFYWYQKAAEQGNALAQFSLGIMYESGIGTTMDFTEALYWYEKAAEQNDDFATILGRIYEKRLGVRQNKATAREYYGLACENGHQLGCDQYSRLNDE